MKKFSIVLLALLLAGGFAFAEISPMTGSADLSFLYDLDASNVGLDNATDTSDVEFSFTLDTAAASAQGEADVYAVIEMSGSIDVNIDGTDNGDGIDYDGDGETDDVDTVAEAGDEISTDVSIDTAKIVGPDWELSILGMQDALNWATSFQDLDGDDDVDSDDNDVSGSFGAGDGFTFTYQDYTVGADYWNPGSGAATYALYAATGLELQEGVTVGLAAGLDENDLDFSAKAGYATDNLTVDVAADVIDVINALDFDASLTAKTTVSDAAVTVNGYYGNDLGVQGIVAYDPITVSVTGSTLVNAWALDAEVEVVVDETLTVGANGGFDVNSAWNAGGDVTYTQADYVAKLGGGYNSDSELSLEASVESTTIVDGATLGVSYAGYDILDGKAGAHADGDKGVVKTYVSIAL
jgi:hypothetical protein